MARINLQRYGTGSKRRVARIRWKRWEIIHVAILSLLMIAFCVWVGIWLATHKFD